MDTQQIIKLSGAAQTLYSVTLHIRGVVEPHTYIGGKDAGSHFYIGGTGQQPSNYNTYSVVVSSPAQTFYLNSDTQAEASPTDLDFYALSRVTARSRSRR